MVVAFWLEGSGNGALDAGGSGKFILLLFAGIATAVPMALFSAAARNLPLLTLGLTEYISPSIALILGIFLFKEPFDMIQFSAFVIIWTHGQRSRADYSPRGHKESDTTEQSTQQTSDGELSLSLWILKVKSCPFFFIN